jgi:hypothetical protein
MSMTQTLREEYTYWPSFTRVKWEIEIPTNCILELDNAPAPACRI